jgi:hypothetical protein
MQFAERGPNALNKNDAWSHWKPPNLAAYTFLVEKRNGGDIHETAHAAGIIACHLRRRPEINLREARIAGREGPVSPRILKCALKRPPRR